jgi:polar amino acid transport system substrate-binding protein
MRPVLCISLAFGAVACSLPRDPEGTLDRVRGGTLRAGVAINHPWVTDSAGTYGGIEPALVRALAAELQANIQWVTGGENALMPALHERELDLVVGGLDNQTPWAKQVGVTRPYHTVMEPEKHEMVWAVAPGENAWQMRVERFLRAHRADVDSIKGRAMAATR